MVLPQEIEKAIDKGEMTIEQIRQLITLEAEETGWTFDEALEWARSGRPPEDAWQADIRLLVYLLESSSAAA